MTDEAADIQAVINEFLDRRLQEALKKPNQDKDDGGNKRETLQERYQPKTWIADAARRVGWIQQVTHAVKFTHPDARGTNLYSQGNPTAGDLLVGTHTLGSGADGDVVGNAAALDVYKFLQLQVGERTLLERAIAADPALAAAFSDDAAHEWMAAFASLKGERNNLASHNLAKQVFWPLAEGGYHLLAPLFSSSLAHQVWRRIREDRFSDASKSARDAKKSAQSHRSGFCEYPNLVVQKLGGTKPQNISQLNSERHGENYLLASVPPSWHSEPVRPPLHVESIFDRLFGRQKQVRSLTKALGNFLSNRQGLNNIELRNRRAEFVDLIRDELVQFAAEVQALPAGWSVQQDCRLNPEERYWLDPLRAEEDAAFATLRNNTDWIDAIARRFGRWLNTQLSTDQTPMGDPEFLEWYSVMKEELRLICETGDTND